MTRDPDHALALLRRLDFDTYLSCLYLPQVVRRDIATLWAFDAEIDRVPMLVSEAMPGEIRLQWWRDRLMWSEKDHETSPLADALLNVIERNSLPVETFHAYLDARIFDLYNDPMPDTGSLEGYLGETVAVHFMNAALCFGAERSTLLADACGHAGMAVGIGRILMRLALDRHKRRIYVPKETLSSRLLSSEGWLDGEIDDQHLLVVEDLCQLGQYHYTVAQSQIGELPAVLKPLFLPLSQVPLRLKAVRKADSDAFSKPLVISPLKRYWALFYSATF